MKVIYNSYQEKLKTKKVTTNSHHFLKSFYDM